MPVFGLAAGIGGAASGLSKGLTISAIAVAGVILLLGEYLLFMRGRGDRDS